MDVLARFYIDAGEADDLPITLDSGSNRNRSDGELVSGRDGLFSGDAFLRQIGSRFDFHTRNDDIVVRVKANNR